MPTDLTAGWYRRVNDVLREEPQLSTSLCKETETVQDGSPNGTDYSKTVCDLTRAIYRSGKDVPKLTKQQIIGSATSVLILDTPLPVVRELMQKPVPVRSAEPKKTAPAKPKPPEKPVSPRPKVEPSEPKPAAKVEPKPVVKAEVKPELKPLNRPAEPAPAKPAPAKPVPAKPAPAAAAVVRESEDTDVEAKPAPKTALSKPIKSGTKPSTDEITYIRDKIPYIPGLTIINNLHAIMLLMEPYVRRGDKVAADLNDEFATLIDKVYVLVTLPSGG